MQFLYPALTIGFLLALLPPLIHLINMMRHRRVKWAAMEFLLQSYKRHRTWIWMKQLILLLLRIAAILLLIAMLAQLVTQQRYEGIFGNRVTHHYLLLDDSYSMTDRAGGSTAFERALNFVSQLGTEAGRQELPQRFTLIRFSRAAMASNEAAANSDTELVADLNAARVDSEFQARLESLRRTLRPSQTAARPNAALQTVRNLMEQNGQETRIVYLVSDFRSNQWETTREIQQLLGDLEQSDTQLEFVNCVSSQRSNLAITDLQPAQETRAAGVPLAVNVEVTNFGVEAAQNVPLKVRTTFFSDQTNTAGDAERPEGEMDEVPLIEIPRIEAGESITERVQVFFPDSGQHVVEAILPEDSVATDNRRWCVIDLPANELVLVIDGDPAQRNAFYLESIFQPGQRARTGVRPEIQDIAYLRDTNPESLQKYRVIYLFDVGRMDDRAVSNLETYVQAGGGLAIFAGPNVNFNFYTERLYRDGEGLFPLPLARDDLLMVDPSNDVPDIEVVVPKHPVFREIQEGQNPIIRLIHVERFLRPPATWAPDPDSNVQVLAKLRNQLPLAVEKGFGNGRVLTILTSFAPDWNDLVLGPNVLMALRLQSYLGNAGRTTEDRLVGNRIDLQLDADRYRPDFLIVAPGLEVARPRIIDRLAEKPLADSHTLAASIQSDELGLAGVYEVVKHTLDGNIDAQRYAVNVDSREGNLAMASPNQLVEQLAPIPIEIRAADQFETSSMEQAGYNQSLLLMCILVALLTLEQFVAYLASFHPARGAVR
jgi:hypothetical protein